MKALLFGTLVVASIASAALPPPGFETYPVHQVYVGTSAPLRLRTELQKSYADLLNAQTLGPANFSGHYRITQLSCGTACHQLAIIDLRTGEVTMPNFTLMNPASGELAQMRTMKFRADSELLILRGSLAHEAAGHAAGTTAMNDPALAGRGIHYFRWDGKRLQPLADTR